MKSRAFSKILIILVLLVIGCCSVWIFHRLSISQHEIRNVVLISIDTCRADYLNCYSYPLNTTPNIDNLARNGILFENVYTPVPFTLPAHCSMLTGTVPAYHGVLDNLGYRLSEDNITLAETLSDNGFKTAAFIGAFVLDSQFGLAQGFDSYEDEFEKEQITVGIVERTGDETTRHVIEWLEEKRGEKNFIFLHYYDPHFSYDPPEPFASMFKNIPPLNKLPADSGLTPGLLGLYAGEIAFTDHCIGRIIEKLKEVGIYDSSLIIITSDHGESLGEHREQTHGYYIYQSTIKVPLVFILPGGPKAKRINTPVSLIDIPPTVCSLLGIESPNVTQGKDLLPYFNGQSQPYPDRHIYCQSLGPTIYMANSLLGVVNDSYKYIQTTRPELYDIIQDPQELDNLIDSQSNRARIMKDKLQQILESTVRNEAASDATHELDEQTLKRLETLGYLGGSVSEDFSFDQSKEDPKDLIDYHCLNTKLGGLVANKKFDRARRICAELISKRPSFHKPYFDLAKISGQEKKYEEVIKLLEKTLELKPGYTPALEGLVDAYNSLNKLDKAVEQSLKILEIQPGNLKTYFHMASLLYDQGKFAEADKYLTKELESNPSFVEMMLSLTDKLLEKGQIRFAYSNYLKMLEINHESADVLNSLAWFEGTSNINGIRNPQQALDHALKACKLTDFSNYEALDTLAVAYAAVGKFDMAVKTAEKAELLAMEDDNKGFVQRVQGRLDLYKSGRMYIDSGLKQ